MRFARTFFILGIFLCGGIGLGLYQWLYGQEAPAEQSAEAPPEVPKGVEVMARGPIHEAFAAPTTEPAPTKCVAKKPPEPLNEAPPEQKPEGDVVWIGGYWAWDDDRNDYLWVSGIWRSVPPGKQWVAGYFREQGDQWQWVNGFWTEAAAKQEEAKQVTYLPEPPKAPAVADPGQPPNPESFYVPGSYVWSGERYGWRAGYWAHVQPGYVWVPAHFRWTPSGYVYIAGYWDFAVSRRGFLYAPVVVNYEVVGPTFVYTPAYAVTDTIVLDSLFIRPCCCHYYFGDYYGPRYRAWGFESCVVYSRRNYDAIIVYERFEHRRDPAWLSVQIDLCGRRDRGLAPCPPRTLVLQGRYHTAVLVSPARLAASRNMRVVRLDEAGRHQALAHARAVREVAVERRRSELAAHGIPSRPRQAALRLPPAHPVRAAHEVRPAVAPRMGGPGGVGRIGNPSSGHSPPVRPSIPPRPNVRPVPRPAPPPARRPPPNNRQPPDNKKRPPGN